MSPSRADPASSGHAAAATLIGSNNSFVDISSRFHTLFNESRRRGFVCLPVERDYSQALTTLMHAADSTLCAFQKPVYCSKGSQPIFHVSIASFVATSSAEPSVTMTPALDGLQEKTEKAVFVACSETDDEDEVACSRPKTEENQTDAKAGAVQSYLLCAQQLHCVECRLGNRVFRMPLPIGASSAFLEAL
jgi:hypothetical protein